jgi:hypothetical protein
MHFKLLFKTLLFTSDGMLVHDIHWRLISNIAQSVICGTVMKCYCSAETTILLERIYFVSQCQACQLAVPSAIGVRSVCAEHYKKNSV